MRWLLFICLPILWLFTISPTLLGQADGKGSSKIQIPEDILNPKAHDEKIKPPIQETNIKAAENEVLTTDAAKRTYEDYVKATYEHNMWALKHKQQIYEWQHWASIMVFVITIVIVIIGIYMSWLQFHTHNKQMANAIDTNPLLSTQTDTTTISPGEEVADAPQPKRMVAGKTAEETSTQFEFSASGAKVSTPIVGVVILTLSLAFFYLYLKFVFPIE